MTDLFTLAELASLLQVATVDTATATLVRDLATSKVQGSAPRAFIVAGSHTLTVPVTKGLVRLPRPVTSVTSVTWVVDNGALIPASGWSFDGMDTIAGLIAGVWPNGQVTVQYPPPTTVQVVYVGGYATPPTDVKDIALAVACRMYDNPRGLQSSSFTAGRYSETEQYAGGGKEIAGTQLLDSEVKALRVYRRGAGTSRLG